MKLIKLIEKKNIQNKKPHVPENKALNSRTNYKYIILNSNRNRDCNNRLRTTPKTMTTTMTNSTRQLLKDEKFLTKTMKTREREIFKLHPKKYIRTVFQVPPIWIPLQSIPFTSNLEVCFMLPERERDVAIRFFFILVDSHHPITFL